MKPATARSIGAPPRRTARRRTSSESPADARPDRARARVPRVLVVGPAPPPSGGMANQCRQLVRLLSNEGVHVEFVRNNPDYRPAFVRSLPLVRAAFRAVPYMRSLWRAVADADVMHVFANSGWAWHLFAAPAIAIANLRGLPVIVNYRGGNADSFLSSAPRHVRRMLGNAAALVAPSEYLQRVFARHGLESSVIPNIVDLARFVPRAPRSFGDSPHLVVTRNLEPIYDIPTAIRAFAQVRQSFPAATLTIAGSGPTRDPCEVLVRELGLVGAVTFSGRIDNDRIAPLYASADLALNPSTVDNMPISILEAFASAVPVVTTNVGGIPFIAEDGVSALLVPPSDPEALATAALRVLGDPALALRLTAAGRARAGDYGWPTVRERWLDMYRRVARQHRAA